MSANFNITNHLTLRITTTIIKNILLLTSNFNLPYDVSEKIYRATIYNAAQKIINAWYNHIVFHNTNLSYLMTLMPLKHGNYNNTLIYYYDLHDINVLITLRICFKNFDPYICSIQWWMDMMIKAFNGTLFTNHDSETQMIYIENVTIINTFMRILLHHSDGFLPDENDIYSFVTG